MQPSRKQFGCCDVSAQLSPEEEGHHVCILDGLSSYPYPNCELNEVNEGHCFPTRVALGEKSENFPLYLGSSSAASSTHLHQRLLGKGSGLGAQEPRFQFHSGANKIGDSEQSLSSPHLCFVGGIPEGWIKAVLSRHIIYDPVKAPSDSACVGHSPRACISHKLPADAVAPAGLTNAEQPGPGGILRALLALKGQTWSCGTRHEKRDRCPDWGQRGQHRIYEMAPRGPFNQ